MAKRIKNKDLKTVNALRKKLEYSPLSDDQLTELTQTQTAKSVIADLTEKADVKKEITRLQQAVRVRTEIFWNTQKNDKKFLAMSKDDQTRELNRQVAEISKLDNQITLGYQYLAGDIDKNEYETDMKIKAPVLDSENPKDDYAQYLDDVQDKYKKKGKETVFKKNMNEYTEKGFDSMLPFPEPDLQNQSYKNFIANLKNHVIECLVKTPTTIENITVNNDGISHDYLYKFLRKNVTDIDLMKLYLYSLKKGKMYTIWGQSDGKAQTFLSQITKSTDTWLYFKNMLHTDVIEVLQA